MKKFCLLLFLFSCASGRQPMTIESYSSISEGVTEQTLITKLGKPDKISDLKNGAKEFEYIENIKIAEQTIETRHYYFHLKDGSVYLKKMAINQFPYEKSSHDLETTELKF